MAVVFNAHRIKDKRYNVEKQSNCLKERQKKAVTNEFVSVASIAIVQMSLLRHSQRLNSTPLSLGYLKTEKKYSFF